MRNTGQRLIIQITQKNTAEKSLVQTNQMISWRVRYHAQLGCSFLAARDLENLAGDGKFQ